MERTMTDWKDSVRAYCDKWRAYARNVRDGSIPPGATERELSSLCRDFESRGLHLDDEVIALLRIVNGTSYNGLAFDGAAIPDRDVYHREDLVHSNDQYNDEPSRYTLYGTWDTDLYRFDNVASEYQVLDNGGGGVMKTFPTFGELVEYAITTYVLKPIQEQLEP